MDTNLKKANRFPWAKGIAFLLAVLSLGLAVNLFYNLILNTKGLEVLSERDYSQSQDLLEYQQQIYQGLNNLLKYKNEENIRKGNTIDKAEFENKKEEMYWEWYRQFEPAQSLDQLNSTTAENKVVKYQLFKEKFNTEKAAEINRLYNSMIEDDLKSYYSLLQAVTNKPGLVYYATNGQVTFANTDLKDRNSFARFKAYFLGDREGYKTIPPSKDERNNHFMFNPYADYSVANGNTVYIGIKDDYLAQKQIEWDQQHAQVQYGVSRIVAALILSLIALVYLLWSCGRKAESQEVHLNTIDRLYTDVVVLFLFGVTLAWLGGLIGYAQSGLLKNYAVTSLYYAPLDFWIILLYNAFAFSMVLALLLSLVRQVKNRTLLRHSLVYKILKKLVNVLRSIMESGPFTLRLIVEILFNPKSFSQIADGVQKIKNGHWDHAIEVKGEGLLANLAQNVNTIADGLKNAVAKEIKAERMKSELVTNVSHDLKTPLTSIINYADLLSQEKLTPEAANDYVAVIKQKSERLKQLTQDLFEISRIQSGNITVEVERIDLSVLVKQTLGELEEQIDKSGLEFKVNIQDEDTAVLADGKRLSRALENLIQNILKYTLANTRVYVDVFTADGYVVAEFKNIANYEMNFREDEILERFVRGDQARTTEGNGLGLAIAESNVVACGGTLRIKIDGDLFKVVVQFDKA